MSPVPYHRLATLRPAWAAPAKPLLTVGAAFMAYLVLISVVLVLTILVLAVAPGVNVAIGVTSGDPTSPLDVTLALAMGSMWLPAGIIGVRAGGWRPLGTAWSVAARLRRGHLRPHLAGGAVIGLLAVGAAAVAGAIAGADGGAGSGASVPQLLLVAFVVLLLAPVQAAGLELALRGVVLQALGTWLRSPVVPFLAATGVMLVGRELTPAVVLPSLALGLAAAVLTWKSGGLELPIALTTTVTIASHLVSALGAGSGAAAGAAALNAAAAAPGTSSAALAHHAAGGALAGGIAGAMALLLATAGAMAWVSARDGVRLLEPVGRPADAPAPAAVPH